MQRRNLQEGLQHSDENIEVESSHGSCYVNPTPDSAEMKGIAGQNCKCQQHQRNDTDLVRRQKVIERKAKAGQARCHGGREEERSPAVEAFPGEQTEYHDQP